MEDQEVATEEQVILAWLQAEMESVAFQQYIAGEPPDPAYLAHVLKAARKPTRGDAAQDERGRAIVSKTHGFGLGVLSFEGLANDLRWRKARAGSLELGELLYANRHPAWSALAPVSRKVAEGAANVGHVFTGDLTNMLVLALALKISESNPLPALPEVICLQRPEWRVVSLEGHTRPTGIVLEGHRFKKGVSIYAGEGPSAFPTGCIYDG